ncbi:Uncharacterised protein [Vibrio cholerae]|nr:Uncharacterised protein [Vibrio cholerae]CSB91712.1 Uncharacterised protein [Vibrio cholerae]CSC07804.1 Uncharacterised protein [Vibrio cholerae]CSD02965.1 Uncharacterised protein [Vibrio cholerae]CSD42589.1 Uncharacterised protein [Vibrio cholerae]
MLLVGQCFILEMRGHLVWINALLIKPVGLAIDYRNQLKIHAVALFQFLFLFGKQLEPAGANIAFATQRNRDVFLSLEELFVNGVNQ